MEGEKMTLDQVPTGQVCVVESLNLTGIMRRRVQDLGMIPGTKVVPIKKSASKGPTAFRIRESVYALREGDARNINVTLV
ncbi:MAG: ferrous iron transport protein A [Bacteroidales bacterium]|nr:ferrous iron transport protein A [Bacteroidales bacterium]